MVNIILEYFPQKVNTNTESFQWKEVVYIKKEPDYSKMTNEEVNELICWILHKEYSNESKLKALLISSIWQSLILIILSVKLFLL